MSRKKSSGPSENADPPKTPKVWEKARRDKMKVYFNELQEVLPFYDPSAPMSRFEILQKSRAYIKDLQNQNQDLLSGGFDEVYKSKMDKLKQRVKELLQRVDQLTDLLRRANIMIPPLVPCSEKQDNSGLPQKWMNQRPRKWTEKIDVIVPNEKIENILSIIKDLKKKTPKAAAGSKNIKTYGKPIESKVQSAKKPTFSERIEMRKKKQLKKIKASKLTKVSDVIRAKSDKKKESDGFADSQSPSHTKENQPVDFNLPTSEGASTKSAEVVESGENVSPRGDKGCAEQPNAKTSGNDGDKISVAAGKMNNIIETRSSNVFLPASANVMPSNAYLLTNDGNLVQFPVLNSSGNVFGANLTQTAIVNQPSSSLITPLVINRPSPVIVLQKPAPQIIQAAQIVNPTPQILSVPNPNIQILSNSIVCATSGQNTKSLPYILSKQPASKKRIAKDSTMTTYVNKIPIPALSKQSYVKKTVGLSAIPKGKNASASKARDAKEKSTEGEKATDESEVPSNEKEIQTDKCPEGPTTEEEGAQTEPEKESEPKADEAPAQKRGVPEEDTTAQAKKQKLSDKAVDDNLFKPIDNPIEVPSDDGLFCNLKLPNAVNHNLSVSPTAAFLSTFPIVASSKFEVEDELASKLEERRTGEDKNAKPNRGKTSKDKEVPNETPTLPIVSNSKACNLPVPEMTVKETVPAAVTIPQEKESDSGILVQATCSGTEMTTNMAVSSMNASNNNAGEDKSSSNSNNVSNRSIVPSDQCSQLIDPNKSWEEYQQAKSCDVRADPFYIHPEIHNPMPPPPPDAPSSMPTFADSTPNPNPVLYKSAYQQSNMKTNFNAPAPNNNNQFEYAPKDNFMSKRMNYNVDRNLVKKPCSNVVNDGYAMAKPQAPVYQTESTPGYQLMSVKDPNQRNSRPPVNWMTEPDVRSRTMAYAPQMEKMAKPPPQPENVFYGNNHSVKAQGADADYVLADGSKLGYQKNDLFYVNKPPEVQMKAPDPRCKAVDKRPEQKYPVKPPQNSCNIFDYNYNGNYFGEDDGSKFCNVQTFQASPAKTKKGAMTAPKKKSEDHVVAPMEFNQECFSWVPGKNVEWLPSKSFVDTNLILPSTLPTLVGDLALGTTTTSDVGQAKTGQNPRSNHVKTGLEPPGKSYIDLGLGNNTAPPFAKALEPVPDKQYLEPFANLSKNIFDVTPSNNMANAKNDCANETIVLKNIFELPVSKGFAGDFPGRTKQRTVSNSQNTFLSVSQLVETPNYDSSIKNDVAAATGMEAGVAKQAEAYGQAYGNYHQAKYKNKVRNTHYKYNDRKYHGYKNGSSNYTAEALIRTNPNLSYQSSGNEYHQPEVNSNFYPGKNPPHKAEGFVSGNKGNDFEGLPKADLCSTQNIYADFNFSSPVPNFNLGASTGAGEYAPHDGGFSSQNNTFFGDFAPPEYPITESVSNSLLLPPCSIALQNPFIVDKRNATPEKGKGQPGKTCANSRSRKSFDCSKSYGSEFSSSGIFTSASLPCPTIFTTTTTASASSCQNLLPVPNQNVPDPNITFPASSFAASNIPFPPLTSAGGYHRGTSSSVAHNAFFPSTCHSVFPSCSAPAAATTATTTTTTTTTVASSSSSSRTCLSTTSSSAVITTTPFPPASQSSLPFLSLSNPIVPPSVPSTSGNSLANFNLSTIFPEINQKGNYHYP